ncbi:DUF624 domain-containing protein [Aestuariimicrobium soli]|uniref:DUF624 domain-containing protein n=1 Tax=Aestuariimicrobium soli TaxID=2035834 RepID=UPI003EBC1134
MANLLSPYSPLSRFLAKLADVMVLNLLFIATSLPVVTLGASLTALNDTAMRLVTDDYESVSRRYLDSFRANFKQGTILGVICLLLLAVVGAWWVVAENLNVSTGWRIVLWIGVIWFGFRVVSTILFVFPYQATFENSVPEVLNISRRMSARHGVSAFTVALVSVLAVVVSVWYPIAVGWGIAWLAFGFAGIAFLNATVFVRVFRRYGAFPDTPPAMN